MPTAKQWVLAVTTGMTIAALTGVGVAVLITKATCHTDANRESSVTPWACHETAESVFFLGAFAAFETLIGVGIVMFLVMSWCRQAETTHLSEHLSESALDSIATAHEQSALDSIATAHEQADEDRATLIQACIYVCDRLTSRALSDRLTTALTAAGVSLVEPDGLPFDPSYHEAGGTCPTSNAAEDSTIAATDMPGYTDRSGHIIRAPLVTVYRLQQRGEYQ